MLNWFISTEDYKALGQDENLKAPARNDGWKDYPGVAFRSPSTDTLPDDSALIKTGGNALQAVPLNALRTNQVVVAVTVLEGQKPGQAILVAAPDGRMVSAVIPERYQAGHTFLVYFAPILTSAENHVLVTGVPVDDVNQKPGDYVPPSQPEISNLVATAPMVSRPMQHQDDLHSSISQNQSTEVNSFSKQHLTSKKQISNHLDAKGLVLVHIPPGANPGDKVRVILPDQSEFDAMIPQGLNGVTHFYVKPSPKKQNWHDNPLAYGAPMAVGLLLA